MSHEIEPLSEFIAFAKKKKKGFLLLTPKSGKAPVTVQFGARILPGEGAKGSFHYQDKVLYLAADTFGPAHVKGLQKTLKDDGFFTIHVALEGAVVDLEGSGFDALDDEWQAMKKVLDRHPMSQLVQRQYDRVVQLLKASPPDLNAIGKAMRVLDPEVAQLKTRKGGHGEAAELREKGRSNDQSKIAKIRTAWTRLERQVRSGTLTRPVREDLALMEKLIGAEAPDEKALTAVYERLVDFVKGGAAAGDTRLARQMLSQWQQTILPDLNKIIAFRIRSLGQGAPEAGKLAALARQLPQMLGGEEPDLDRAKKTMALFVQARKDMISAGGAG